MVPWKVVLGGLTGLWLFSFTACKTPFLGLLPGTTMILFFCFVFFFLSFFPKEHKPSGHLTVTEA